MIKILTYRLLCNNLLTSLFEHHVRNIMGYQQLLTIEEVADYLRVKKRTIYEWIKTGKIPAIKAVGQWRFKKEKIDAWLDNQK